MPKDDEKLLRQLSLVSFLLEQRRPVTPRHIQERVEGYAGMSDQTFARRFYDDRSDLAQAGIRIEGSADDDEGEAYFLPDENFRLPTLDLTREELRALSVALTLLDGHFAYARPLRLALVNLTHGHPEPDSEELERIAVSLAPDEEAVTLGGALARLDDAIARGKTVRFPYPSGPDLESEERVVDPYVLSRRGGHWYVGGLDHDRGSMRTFRLSRMAGPVRFSTKRVRDFSPPAQIDDNEFGARPPWQFGEIVGAATVRVEDELAWWVSRTYPGVTVAAETDRSAAPDRGADAGRPGSTVFTTPYADVDELIAWVLSLGRRAVLIDPPEVRERLRLRLTTIEAAHA
jgi:predicted DNA-binding transcriptional regulator YafY